MVSACICIPVNLILVFLFRTIRPSYIEPVKKASPFAISKTHGSKRLTKREKESDGTNGVKPANGDANGYIQINIIEPDDVVDAVEEVDRYQHSDDEKTASKRSLLSGKV